MTATCGCTTDIVRADRAARTKRLTVPLTELQAEFVSATARRLGWSQATLIREALFRYTATLDSRSGDRQPGLTGGQTR